MRLGVTSCVMLLICFFFCLLATNKRCGDDREKDT